jgi:hypothetical protein
MNDFLESLAGGDRRSIGRADRVVKKIDSQNKFDNLFEGLFHDDYVVAMRTADVIEKVTRRHPEFLRPHKKAILKNLNGFSEKEIRWHAAQMVPRLDMNEKELADTLKVLNQWLREEKSEIVKVMSLQALYDLSQKHDGLKPEVEEILEKQFVSGSPSVRARARKLLK